jgi:hypothetical protein
MGDPFAPRFSLFDKPKSVFGDQFTLKLDPDIEAEINRLQYKLLFDHLESALYQPDWSVIDLTLRTNMLPPAPAANPLSPVSPGAAKPPSASGTVSEPANPPLRKGEASDLLKAVWKLPVVESAVNDMKGQLDKTWRNMGTSDKVAVIATGVMIGGPIVSELVSNDMTRTWILQKMSGVYIPVPKVDGLKFALMAPAGVIRGGGLSYENKVFSVKAGYERAQLPDNTQFNNLNLELNLNVGEAVTSIGKMLKK